jgi:hypothetical protein
VTRSARRCKAEGLGLANISWSSPRIQGAMHGGKVRNVQDDRRKLAHTFAQAFGSLLRSKGCRQAIEIPYQ